MNILRKLTKLDLKLNKKRTIGTLLGIILATALITVVGGMFEVLRNTLIQNTVNMTGYHHVELINVDREEINKLDKNKVISKVMEVGVVGNTYTGGTEIVEGEEKEDYPDTSYMVLSIDEKTFSDLKYSVVEGTYPKDNNEILVNGSYLIENDLKIGDKIKVSKIKIKNILTLETEEELKDYKIVGITSTFNTFVTTNEESTTYMAFIALKNPKNHIKDISNILEVNNYQKDKSAKYLYNVNKDLLRWEAFSFSEDTTRFLVAALAIVIGIILFTSVFSIRNSFAISTNEKIRLYGMLASTGATKKQIRRMVLFEGLCLGVIGIGIGVVFGSFIVWLLTLIINFVAKDANLVSDGMMMYYKFSVMPIILAILVSVVMIYLSTISSSIKAGRVSPIQNIRNSDKIKAKKLKVPFIIRKLFKTGGTLAYKNLKRSKKKYRVTVISLTISIFIFITTSSFLDYGLKAIHDEFGGIDYDVVAEFYGEEVEKKLDYNKLTSLAESHIVYQNYHNGRYELKDISHVTNENALGTGCIEIDENHNCINENKVVNIIEYFYDDTSFKEISKKIGANYDDIKDKAIIINYIKENKKKVALTDYKKGDTYTLTNPFDNDSYTYTIGAVTDYYPWGTGGSWKYDIKIVLNEKYYKGKNKLNLEAIYYKTNSASKLTKELKDLGKENDLPNGEYYITNISEQAKQINAVILILSIFIYGFIIVVTLIGITSVFNTINSNMELRRREFATLKSIGMTKKEFNRMILLESIFYSIKSLFFGIILGIGGSYLVYQAFTKQMDFGYLLPVKSIIISIVFIIVLVYTIMKYSLSKTNKQNIIETIRKENI